MIFYSFKGNKIEPQNIFRQLSIEAPYIDMIDEFSLEEMIGFHFKKPAGKIMRSEMLEIMGLEIHKYKKTGAFSSGMKQRTKLNLAFTSDSPLFFWMNPVPILDDKGIWYHDQSIRKNK